MTDDKDLGAIARKVVLPYTSFETLDDIPEKDYFGIRNWYGVFLFQHVIDMDRHPHHFWVSYGFWGLETLEKMEEYDVPYPRAMMTTVELIDMMRLLGANSSDWGSGNNVFSISLPALDEVFGTAEEPPIMDQQKVSELLGIHTIDGSQFLGIEDYEAIEVQFDGLDEEDSGIREDDLDDLLITAKPTLEDEIEFLIPGDSANFMRPVMAARKGEVAKMIELSIAELNPDDSPEMNRQIITMLAVQVIAAIRGRLEDSEGTSLL